MSKIRYTTLAPLVRALLVPVQTRPGPSTFVDRCFAEVEREAATGPEEDDAPPTQRRAA